MTVSLEDQARAGLTERHYRLRGSARDLKTAKPLAHLERNVEVWARENQLEGWEWPLLHSSPQGHRGAGWWSLRAGETQGCLELFRSPRIEALDLHVWQRCRRRQSTDFDGFPNLWVGTRIRLLVLETNLVTMSRFGGDTSRLVNKNETLRLLLDSRSYVTWSQHILSHGWFSICRNFKRKFTINIYIIRYSQRPRFVLKPYLITQNFCWCWH